MRRAAALLHGDVVAAMAGGGDLCCGARDVLLAGVAGVCRRRGAGLGLGRLCCRGGRVRAQGVSWRCCVVFFGGFRTCIFLIFANLLAGGGTCIVGGWRDIIAGGRWGLRWLWHIAGWFSCGILGFCKKNIYLSYFLAPDGGCVFIHAAYHSVWGFFFCFFFVLLDCG